MVNEKELGFQQKEPLEITSGREIMGVGNTNPLQNLKFHYCPLPDCMSGMKHIYSSSLELLTLRENFKRKCLISKESVSFSYG